MTSRGTKEKHPLPVIDLGRLLGSSDTCLTSLNKERSKAPKNTRTARTEAHEDTASEQVGLSHMHRYGELRHPASTAQALVSMQRLSFNESLMLGTSLPYQDTNVVRGNSGAANDSSLVVAKSDSRKSSAMQARSFLPVQQGTILVGGKENITPQVDPMPAKLAAEVNVENDAVKAGNVGDTNTGTQQVMPNRNICVPLGPVPSVCLVTPEDDRSIPLPDFRQLINYNYFRQASKDSNKTCVMCGVTCQYLHTKQDHKDELPFILRKEKGVCNVCQDTIWAVVGSKLEIRFCYFCRTFHPWVAFVNNVGQVMRKCESCRCLQSKKRSAPIVTEPVSNVPKSTGVNRCVMLPQPVKLPSPCNLETTDGTKLPSFDRIVNYPANIGKDPDKSGNKCCVMCSKSLPCPFRRNQTRPYHCINPKNKDVCTICEVTVWQFAETGILIKFCDRCKQFCPFAGFRGHDNTATKTCANCRRKRKERS